MKYRHITHAVLWLFAYICIVHGMNYVRVPECELPIAYSVDVVVVGASEAGVSAALSAAENGAEVLLLSRNYYVGRQVTAKRRCWFVSGESSSNAIAEKMFGSAASGSGTRFINPGDFKVTVEQALQDAGVHLLYKTYGVGVVVDGNGKISGVVMANKAGRQVVIAKVVVDATQMGGIARLAGADFTSWDAQQIEMTRSYHAGGTMSTASGDWVGNKFYIAHHTAAMHNGSWVDRCASATVLRKENIVEYNWPAHEVHYNEPVSIVAQKEYSASSWGGASNLDLDYCRPQGIDYLYVLGSATAVSREHADDLVRPLSQVELGVRVGDAVHSDASGRSMPSNVSVKTISGGSTVSGVVTSEVLQGYRPGHDYSSVHVDEDMIPIWGEYDVVVVGGGTAGAPAAISAARNGAKVLLVEMLGVLGGTRRMIVSYWRGYRHGFNQEVAFGNDNSGKISNGLLEKAIDEGVDIWFNTLGCGAVKENDRVNGVVLASPMGRGAVLANFVIDASGDGDIATHAGASTDYLDGDLSLLSTSYLCDAEQPQYSGINEWPDKTVDPWDIHNLTWYHVFNRRRKAGCYEYHPLCGFRGNRRIIGEYVVGVADMRFDRPYHDGINVGYSNYDMHGIPIAEPGAYAGLMPPPRVDKRFIIPYRSVLPKGLKGMLMVGRCMSATTDALAMSRMQPDLINQGYAAGYISAKCTEEKIALRDVDISAVQDHLVSIGNISSSIQSEKLTQWEVSDNELIEAAQKAGDTTHAALLLSVGQRSISFLRDSFKDNPDNEKAELLCLLKDTTAVDYLSNWLDGQSLNDYEAQEPFGGAGTRVPGIDHAIWALGMAGDARAADAIAAKINEISMYDFSHERALFGAASMIGSSKCVPAIEAYLDNRYRGRGEPLTIQSEEANKDFQLTNLYAAAALYRCGDNAEERGKKMLQDYLNDWRGPYVRYAASVLRGADVPTVNSGPSGRVGFFRDPRSRVKITAKPFRQCIRIEYGMFGTEHIEHIRVYDIMGVIVAERTKQSGDLKPATAALEIRPGTHMYQPAGTGIYLVSIKTNRRTLNSKVIFVN